MPFRSNFLIGENKVKGFVTSLALKVNNDWLQENVGIDDSGKIVRDSSVEFTADFSYGVGNLHK